mmetsp:Transcript_87884/g.200815  ORF Transcript_87884/g.200815 Transcript_87884/m.200815 type:complete len:345 (-) Transcript_87884:439-1473(-)
MSRVPSAVIRASSAGGQPSVRGRCRPGRGPPWAGLRAPGPTSETEESSRNRHRVSGFCGEQQGRDIGMPLLAGDIQCRIAPMPGLARIGLRPQQLLDAGPTSCLRGKHQRSEPVSAPLVQVSPTPRQGPEARCTPVLGCKDQSGVATSILSSRIRPSFQQGIQELRTPAEARKHESGVAAGISQVGVRPGLQEEPGAAKLPVVPRPKAGEHQSGVASWPSGVDVGPSFQQSLDTFLVPLLRSRHQRCVPGWTHCVHLRGADSKRPARLLPAWPRLGNHRGHVRRGVHGAPHGHRRWLFGLVSRSFVVKQHALNSQDQPSRNLHVTPLAVGDLSEAFNAVEPFRM